MRFIPAVSPVQIQVPLPDPKDGTRRLLGSYFSGGSRPLGQHGPLVKWLRHRPFTAVTRVRVSYGSPIWRRSSAGRALASHARGHRFEFCRLHQKSEPLVFGREVRIFCYENLPPEGRNNPARPDGRLIDCISCWIRRSRAGHQVPSPMLSGVSGNYVFFCLD